MARANKDQGTGVAKAAPASDDDIAVASASAEHNMRDDEVNGNVPRLETPPGLSPEDKQLSSASTSSTGVHLQDEGNGKVYSLKTPPENSSPFQDENSLDASQESSEGGAGDVHDATIAILTPPSLTAPVLGSGTSASGSTDGSGNRPGAFHIYPGSDPRPVMGGTFCFVPTSGASDTRPTGNSEPEDSSPRAIEAESQNLENSATIAAEAYLVEQGPDPPAATVVHTYFGIERKRLYYISALSLSALAIVLGCVLGILLPKVNKEEDGTENNVCGPLCGLDTEILNGENIVFGHTCNHWDSSSSYLPAPHGSNGTCSDMYSATAYGCDCPGVEIPSSGCGMLCADGSGIPDPDLMVKDINNRELSCQDWQLEAQFDTDPNKCVNYNVIGVLCGCQDNEPHPKSCGPLCTDGPDSSLHSGHHSIWNTKCKDWDTMSTFLPIWYNNNGRETCEEYYHDVAYGCACPDVRNPLPNCGTLCQQRRTCLPICYDGSAVPDEELIVRRETCQAWELHSRLEVHSIVCPFYHMMGAQCGCDNAPPDDGCGPLCGTEDASLADPNREVHGETCESWDYKSKFLSPSYGKEEFGKGGIISSCSEHFSAVAHGCGCPGFRPPEDGCGPLCSDGSLVPDPSMVVGATTCGDLELISLFDTDPMQCPRHKLHGTLCGCPSNDKYEEECFMLEHLENKTYLFSAERAIYSISFGDGGYFGQMQGNDFFMVGHYHGFGTGPRETVAAYGGGAPCGVYGPRTGSVAVVEDAEVTEPAISYVIEPATCVYHAELKVPTFCNKNNTVFS